MKALLLRDTSSETTKKDLILSLIVLDESLSLIIDFSNKRAFN